MADAVFAIIKSGTAKRQRPANFRQCSGYAVSGQQCKKGCAPGRPFCTTHDRSADIGLPPYVSCNEGRTNLMIFHCMGPQRWRVGNRAPTAFRCLSTGAEYTIQKFIAEGSYGAVYDCAYSASTAEGGCASALKQRVALKACKTTFNSRRLRGAVGMEMMEDDYLRELFVMQVAHDRLAATGDGDDVVVPFMSPFLIKAGAGGLYGCLAMERMEGDLADVFDELETKSKNCNEALRFWALCCRETARMLRRLHEVSVYHLDTKPGNLLIKRTPGVGRGFQLRFIDFGLGAYLPRTAGPQEPLMECRATGTFLPPEWRRNGDKFKPTFVQLTRHDQIEIGEAYALCKTCLDLRQSLHSSVKNGALAKKLSAVKALVAALDAGQKDGSAAAERMRACGGGVRGIEALADAAVRELDSILSSDGEEEMAKARFPMFC